MLVITPAVGDTPVGVKTTAFGVLKLTRFSRLNSSARNCRFNRSVNTILLETDTSMVAAVALMRGMPAGPAWHAAKIAECGGLCTINPTNPGVMMSIDRHGFTMEPLSPQNRCTPETVSAHMLYENSDPFRLVEPASSVLPPPIPVCLIPLSAWHGRVCLLE